MYLVRSQTKYHIIISVIAGTLGFVSKCTIYIAVLLHFDIFQKAQKQLQLENNYFLGIQTNAFQKENLKINFVSYLNFKNVSLMQYTRNSEKATFWLSFLSFFVSFFHFFKGFSISTIICTMELFKAYFLNWIDKILNYSKDFDVRKSGPVSFFNRKLSLLKCRLASM